MHGTENDEHVDYYTHRATFPPGRTAITVNYLISPELWAYTVDLARTWPSTQTDS